jgi:hypothetical protein
LFEDGVNAKSKDKYGETLLWWAAEGWHKMREMYLLNTRLVGLIDEVYKPVVRLLLGKDNDIDFDTIYT